MAAKDTVKARLQSNLSEFSALTRQLLEVVSGELKPVAAGVSTGGVAEQQSQLLSSVLDKLLDRDKEIHQLTETALEMRARQKEIDRIDQELERRTQEIADLQAKLQDAERILEIAVYHGKQKLQSIKQAKEGAVSPEVLIRYSHHISQANSTVSPVGWQPSNPQRPYPQDIEMRNGALGRLTSGIAVEAEEGGAQQEKGGEGNVARRSEKISIEQIGTRVFAGVNQNNNVPPDVGPTATAGGGRGKGGRGGGGKVGSRLNPFDKGAKSFPRMTLGEPEVMSEDSSASSSDEGT